MPRLPPFSPRLSGLPVTPTSRRVSHVRPLLEQAKRQKPYRPEAVPRPPVLGLKVAATSDGEREKTAGLGARVRFLGCRASYPDSPERVESIETHFSWVFVTDFWAYKLKKPVCGEGFDFRTVEQRRGNAESELRLNRRLSPGVYAGIIALTLEPGGGLAIGGGGVPVDWLVKMVRLLPEQMLHDRLVRGNWRYAEIEALAHRLASFYATARLVRGDRLQQIHRLRAELRACFSAFDPIDGLLVRGRRAVRALNAYMARHHDFLVRRFGDRRLVEGHGDLRPEHVYLGGAPKIIDCLEFRADLRRLDPIEELAYLGMECGRLGGSGIEQRLFRRYRQRTGDVPAPDLVRFHKALSALIRARIALAHIAEPGSYAPEELRRRSTLYLAIAADQAGHLGR